jgi:hypothetical protein
VVVHHTFKASLSLLIVCLPALLFAQSAPGCKDRVVITGVLDARGVPVKNLAVTDFTAIYRGKPLTVVSSEYRENPHARVRVLLDVSASMRGESSSDKWKIAHAVASDFVSSAPTGMGVSLWSFSSAVQEKFEASDGRQPIQDWLASSAVRAGSEVKGRTALLDAIVASIHELSPAQPGDAIYVITDGADNVSKTNSSQVERWLLDSGIRLFAFLLPDPIPAQEERLNQLDLDELVRRSGGLLANLDALPTGMRGDYVYDEKTARAIGSATGPLTTQITNFYVLIVAGVDDSAKPKDLNLNVVDAQGHKKKDIVLTYSHRPVGCLR